jgi:hypothetical protein
MASMASQTAYRPENNVPTAYDAAIIRIEDEPRKERPNINVEALVRDRRFSRVEMTMLGDVDGTNLMDRCKREGELPQDVIDSLTKKPVLTIPPASLQAALSIGTPTDGIAALELEQDEQACCNCCNLQ